MEWKARWESQGQVPDWLEKTYWMAKWEAEGKGLTERKKLWEEHQAAATWF
jgi:hypothetical protein